MKMSAHLQNLAQHVQLKSEWIKLWTLSNYCWTFHRDLKCKDAGLSLKDITGGKELEVKPADNTSYPDLGNRTQDCELSMVGKPVFHNYLQMNYGAWLRDPVQKENVTIDKIWLTKEGEPMLLHEYKNRNDLKRDKPSRNPYKLQHAVKVMKTRRIEIFKQFRNYSGKCAHCLQRIFLLFLCGGYKNCSLWVEDRKNIWWI